MLLEETIKYLYHITHVNNIQSILEDGILSHNETKNKTINFNSISNIDVIRRRETIPLPKEGRNLLDYANLYFNPRNSMMFKIFKPELEDKICVLCVNKNIMKCESAIVSDGNAASWKSRKYNYEDGITQVLNQWETINSSSWLPNSEQSRTMMAECLIPNMISPKYIEMIYVPSEKTKLLVEQVVNGRDLQVAVNCRVFFKNDPK